MTREMVIASARIRALLPDWLMALLARLRAEIDGGIWLTGGALRDLLLGRRPVDIDLTIPSGANIWARRLALWSGGTHVPLGRVEDAARLVVDGFVVDLAAFRQGAADMEAELLLRDLRINAFAVRLDPLLCRGEAPAVLPVLDPSGGWEDLEHKRIQEVGPESFVDDPLRLLRVFRFAAELDFTVADGTLAAVERQRLLIRRPAPERRAHELHLIMATPRAHAAFRAMADAGILWEILPELAAGRGMAQPRSHHLDVWGHSLEALRCMEEILADPGVYFPDAEGPLRCAADAHGRVLLKWAALLHDLGKPPTCAPHPEKEGRITFYNHDRAGVDIFRGIAARLRWSQRDTELVAGLIALHMRPFHLANAARSGGLSLRARIRMVRKAGALLPELFCLAMADSLAGQGPERLEGMEAELAGLYRQLEETRLHHVEPVRSSPPLITGRDLIARLSLTPGPVFKSILQAVEEARMEGRVHDRSEALRLASDLAEDLARRAAGQAAAS